MVKFGVKERNLEGQIVVVFTKRMGMTVVNTNFQRGKKQRVPYKSGGRSCRWIFCVHDIISKRL